MTRFHIGVDLGQKRDHTAIAIVGARQGSTERRVLSLERVPLGTPYPTVVERVRAAVQHPELYGRCTLTVDATGVGAPVVDMLRWAQLGCELWAVTITSGDRAHKNNCGWTVPKQDLVCGVQVLLERGDLRIASQLPDAASLVRELRDMRLERSESGKAKMGADGHGEHDDLVIALSLACWRAGKGMVSIFGDFAAAEFLDSGGPIQGRDGTVIAKVGTGMVSYDFAPGDAGLEEFGLAHGIHPLHIEDCHSDEQQAKLEQGDGYLFAVLKLVSLQADDSLHLADVDLFLGADYLVTVHRSAVPAAAAGKTADERFYRVLDAVVDSYLPVLEAVEDRVDLLEDLVIRRPGQRVLEQIADLLTTLLELRRVLGNTRRIAFALQRMESPLIGVELQPFLRDVHDHLERDLGSAAGERERLKGLLDIYHSSLASRNNEATRILTLMGTVSLPAVVIASFFGMSLRYPGWVQWAGAIWVVAGLIVLVTGGLLMYLKRRDYF